MEEIKQGVSLTFEGFGKSARGHMVINGKSVKTGRNMKVVEPTVFKVVQTIPDKAQRVGSMLE
jgi:hypothetical protein